MCLEARMNFAARRNQDHFGFSVAIRQDVSPLLDTLCWSIFGPVKCREVLPRQRQEHRFMLHRHEGPPAFGHFVRVTRTEHHDSRHGPQ